MSTPIVKPPDRLRIVSGPAPVHIASFAEDVREGLAAPRKRLPSKYFYDALGSALFDAITLLPEYYLTRAETEILREWGWEMVRAIGNPVDFVELGSGSAIKTRILIEEALRAQNTLRYSPIDISEEALRASATGLVESYPSLEVIAYAGDYFSILQTDAIARPRRVLAMLMGSNIGNYEPHDGKELLLRIAAALKPGDALLLGADLKKDPAVLHAAYSDPAGVTSAFNLNLLARINRELGGHFDLGDFRHVAEYDEKAGCVRSFLQAVREVSVPIDALGTTVHFASGERVHTESSYKYSDEDIAGLAEETGFDFIRSWNDTQGQFSVNLMQRR